MKRGYTYQKAKKQFLTKYEEHGGWWKCWNCGSMTQSPELDHIERTGMGGSPSLLMDESNWQILCGAGTATNCHGRKDSGMTFH